MLSDAYRLTQSAKQSTTASCFIFEVSKALLGLLVEELQAQHRRTPSSQKSEAGLPSAKPSSAMFLCCPTQNLTGSPYQPVLRDTLHLWIRFIDWYNLRCLNRALDSDQNLASHRAAVTPGKCPPHTTLSYLSGQCVAGFFSHSFVLVFCAFSTPDLVGPRQSAHWETLPNTHLGSDFPEKHLRQLTD